MNHFLALAGVAPGVSLTATITPSVGALTLAGVAPLRVIGDLAEPPTGAAVLAGVAPSLVRGTIITISELMCPAILEN